MKHPVQSYQTTIIKFHIIYTHLKSDKPVYH